MPSIGAVQIQVIPGNIEYNIQKHIQWMEIAKTHGLEAIVFPEMSLTGYDRTPAVELIFSENDHHIFWRYIVWLLNA